MQINRFALTVTWLLAVTLVLTPVSWVVKARDTATVDEQLIEAVKLRDLALAKTLLNNGANASAEDKDGWTALLYAIDRGVSVEVVQLLLDSGADVNAKTVDGRMPLLEAAAGDHQLNGPKWYLLPWYLLRGLLLGPDWGPWYPPGARKSEVVKMLLEKGADINAKDARGRTPLQRARERGATEIADLLKAHGAKE